VAGCFDRICLACGDTRAAPRCSTREDKLLVSQGADRLRASRAQTYFDRFPKPIDMNVTLVVASFLGMLAIASLTVGGQILRAARARPSDGLRHE
jgi:hypothetical protein